MVEMDFITVGGHMRDTRLFWLYEHTRDAWINVVLDCMGKDGLCLSRQTIVKEIYSFRTRTLAVFYCTMSIS